MFWDEFEIVLGVGGISVALINLAIMSWLRSKLNNLHSDFSYAIKSVKRQFLIFTLAYFGIVTASVL